MWEIIQKMRKVVKDNRNIKVVRFIKELSKMI
jgi:hypothetical protein